MTNEEIEKISEKITVILHENIQQEEEPPTMPEYRKENNKSLSTTRQRKIDGLIFPFKICRYAV
jgi:hypothetical protein